MREKATCLSVCVPHNVSAVDEKVNCWVKSVKSNRLCFTAAVPEDQIV